MKTCLICKVQFSEKRYGKNMYCSHKCRGAATKVDPVNSFWNKVKITPGCWVWHGGKTSTGYGMISNRGKLTLAHRFSYELHCEPIEKGLHCLHRCDTPSCVNPNHLFLGTNLDNIKDRIAKGRTLCNPNRGEKHHNAKLKNKQVQTLRKLRDIGWTFNRLATKFSISETTAHKIATRKSYSNVH